jgi:two-component system sensor histidine kinase DctS
MNPRTALRQRLTGWWQVQQSRLHAHGRRLSLWTALLLLVLALLATLVWLAGRYEVSQVVAEVERDAGDAVNDLRTQLNRQAQSLQAVQSRPLFNPAWQTEMQALLRENREWLRVEERDEAMNLRRLADSPLRPPSFDARSRQEVINEVMLACQRARRINAPVYASSYYLPRANGMGAEVLELCLPQSIAGAGWRFTIVALSLQDLLTERLMPRYGRRYEVALTEPDGTRLAIVGSMRPGTRVFTGQQLLDLTGTNLMLRLDGRRAVPDLFPNVMTALVTGMSIALITVLVLLGKDSRRRLRAEKELAEALAFRKAMEDSLVTGLRARDLQGRITYVNPAFCQMVGYSNQELLGHSAPMPYWPPEMAGEYQQRQAIRLAGQALPREGYESVFVRKDGTRFAVLIIEAPLISVQGEQTGWMSAVLDISEQRRVEELSRASQERLQATARLATVGEMASLLSHELNQPLAAIASYANGSLNLLHNPASGTTFDLRIALQRIAQQAERAGKVINSVHDFIRRREHAREDVTPARLFESIAPLVTLQARKLHIEVRWQADAGLPSVWCDRTMVEQVLLNLARNALQAMDAPEITRPVLTLQARPAPDAPTRWVEFRVIDCGVGISPEVAARIFTPFFTTRAEGMGLGLSLCRTVIEQHGGHLDFQPHTPQGTVFRFTLPVPTQEERSAAP